MMYLYKKTKEEADVKQLLEGNDNRINEAILNFTEKS